MKSPTTGETQWLFEQPNHTEVDAHGDKDSNRNLPYYNNSHMEHENAACWIAVFVLLIIIACASTVLAVYHPSIELWSKSGGFFHRQDDSFSSIPSRKQIATAALQSLNDNWRTTLVPQASSSSQSQQQCQVTVLILRHCDDHGLYAKDDAESGDKHCSHLGFRRTQYLPTLFGTRWPPHPQALYALVPPPPSSSQPTTDKGGSRSSAHSTSGGHGRGINYRQIETLLPLAEREDLPIHVVQDPQQVANALVQQLLLIDPIPNSSSSSFNNHHCNEVIVVAWKHAYIPNLAAALGCGPDQGCPDIYPDDSFDLVWELSFVLEPPEPKQEIMDTFSTSSSTQSSFLILQDDYGLMQKVFARKDHDGDDDTDDDDVQAESSSSSTPTSPRWTVYGSVTGLGFDPLAFEYYLVKEGNPLAGNSQLDL